MILLPLISGLVALAVLLPGLRPDAWPLVVVALVLLAFSAWGRWPVTATAFCIALVGLVITHDGQSTWLYVGLGLVLSIYLLMVEAKESLGSLEELPEWAMEQPLRILAVFVGIAAVTVAISLPAVAALPAVIVGAAATALVFVLAMPVQDAAD